MAEKKPKNVRWQDWVQTAADQQVASIKPVRTKRMGKTPTGVANAMRQRARSRAAAYLYKSGMNGISSIEKAEEIIGRISMRRKAPKPDEEPLEWMILTLLKIIQDNHYHPGGSREAVEHITADPDTMDPAPFMIIAASLNKQWINSGKATHPSKRASEAIEALLVAVASLHPEFARKLNSLRGNSIHRKDMPVKQEKRLDVDDALLEFEFMNDYTDPLAVHDPGSF